MANENRNNQNNSSADHTKTSEKKNRTVKKQTNNSFDANVLWELVKKWSVPLKHMQ